MEDQIHQETEYKHTHTHTYTHTYLYEFVSVFDDRKENRRFVALGVVKNLQIYNYIKVTSIVQPIATYMDQNVGRKQKGIKKNWQLLKWVV